MELNFNVIVIGSGPAGMTAAIYLKRAGLNVSIIESNAPGGQVNMIANIENYPGYINGDGPTLAFNMFTQLQKANVTYKYGKVLEIIDNNSYKTIKTDKEELTCEAIVIATGRRPIELGIANEKSFIGRGLSWCALCDASLYKNKDVIVVAANNKALEEVLYLGNIVNKIYMLYYPSEFEVNKELEVKVLNNDKIEIITNSNIIKLNEEDNHLKGINLDNGRFIEASGMFIYKGYKPSLDMVNKLNIKSNNGYLIVDNKMRTNIDNIYACGDAIYKDTYQVVTATAEGTIAATTIINDLTVK
ncbi:MAG: FAD-dependent oxidoreductase [Bacilli bacterium]|nr:FAD-dependent oxidoreductase [Bacilli bacterium]